MREKVNKNSNSKTLPTGRTPEIELIQGSFFQEENEIVEPNKLGTKATYLHTYGHSLVSAGHWFWDPCLPNPWRLKIRVESCVIFVQDLCTSSNLEIISRLPLIPDIMQMLSKLLSCIL